MSDGPQGIFIKLGQALKQKISIQQLNMLVIVKWHGGCITSKEVANLEIIDGVMDKYMYRGILSRNITDFAAKLGMGRRFIFFFPNEPKHTGVLKMDFLKNNIITVLPWPAQSPCLNPIE